MSVELAKKFHDTYERLAPQFGYETRGDTKRFDPETPNGRLMIAVCSEVLSECGTEIERLKALWYTDADPEETEYAEDYYAQIDHRDHVAISKANQKSVDPIADAIDKALQEQRDYFCMSKRTHNYD